MTYNEFYKKYHGKAVDYDKRYNVQCVDLADQYLYDTFGITGVWVQGAREFYTNFSKYPALVKYFDRIPNTRALVAQTGDIIVWGGGDWGHIAIVHDGGDIDYFISFEQNTLGKHESAHLVTHRYNNRTGVDSCYPVLGVLRVKDKYHGLVEHWTARVILAEGLNVRAGAGLKYKVVGELPKDTIFQLDKYVKDSDGRKWARIYGGKYAGNYVCATAFTFRVI